jgi:hypothetical protein
LQLLPGPVHNDGDLDLRDLEHAGDLGVFVTLEEAQGEDLGGARAQFRERASDGFAGIAIAASVNRIGRRLLERDTTGVLTGADYVDGSVDGGPAKIAFRIVDRKRRAIAAEQTQEDRLHDIFGIGGVTGDTVGRPEDESIALFEDALYVARG